jgi:hypothetical protein
MKICFTFDELCQLHRLKFIVNFSSIYRQSFVLQLPNRKTNQPRDVGIKIYFQTFCIIFHTCALLSLSFNVDIIRFYSSCLAFYSCNHSLALIFTKLNNSIPLFCDLNIVSRSLSILISLPSFSWLFIHVLWFRRKKILKQLVVKYYGVWFSL